MIAQAERAKKIIQETHVLSTTRPSVTYVGQSQPAVAHRASTQPLSILGLIGIVTGILMLVSLLLSLPVPGKALSTASAAPPAVNRQQPSMINGHSVYTAPIVTGPQATAILQGVPADAIAYVVHTFDGRGKLISTANSWFRCADIVSASQYNGSQVEVESWTLLTEQERLEAVAACRL